MGVVFSAYAKATPVEGDDHILPVKPDGIPTFTNDFYDDVTHDDGQHLVAFAYAGMEQSLDGLTPGRCYEVEDGIEALARSYSGYGIIRGHISHAILGVDAETVWHNADEYRDRPMYELINFADNEGCIGPKACARLAVDFAENRDTFVSYAKALAPGDEDFYSPDELIEAYDGLARGFEHAADSGLVNLS